MAFTEDWYSDFQLQALVQTFDHVRALEGEIVDIGVWEGKSTIGLARAAYPCLVHAVDTWAGNTTEGAEHPTIQILQTRDVFGCFQQNVAELTKGNIEIHKMDCFEFLRNFRKPIRFCHIDAAHDYRSVRATLELLFPLMVEGGILCGDDYLSAHEGRTDLEGGVQRAVKELLPHHVTIGNFWIGRT